MTSANGQASLAYLESTRKLLSDLNAIQYYQQPLPSELDAGLNVIVGVFTGFSPSERDRFVTGLLPRERSLFGIYGHRAATLSVRRADPAPLRLGLIAVAIANYEIPSKRDVDIALAVFYHCAQKLDVIPQELFDGAAQYAGEEMANRLKQFGRRTDASLKQFGWRELRTEEGVRYKYEWR